MNGTQHTLAELATIGRGVLAGFQPYYFGKLSKKIAQADANLCAVTPKPARKATASADPERFTALGSAQPAGPDAATKA